MAIKIFNTETFGSNANKPAITIGRSNIYINAAGVKFMGIKKGDKVQFALDDTDNDYPDAFISVAREGKGYNTNHKDDGSCTVHARAFDEQLMAAINAEAANKASGYKVLINEKPQRVEGLGNAYLLLISVAKPSLRAKKG